MSTMAGFTESS